MISEVHYEMKGQRDVYSASAVRELCSLHDFYPAIEIGDIEV